MPKETLVEMLRRFGEGTEIEVTYKFDTGPQEEWGPGKTSILERIGYISKITPTTLTLKSYNPRYSGEISDLHLPLHAQSHNDFENIPLENIEAVTLLKAVNAMLPERQQSFY